jgi:hypothetical protein
VDDALERLHAYAGSVNGIQMSFTNLLLTASLTLGRRLLRNRLIFWAGSAGGTEVTHVPTLSRPGVPAGDP